MERAQKELDHVGERTLEEFVELVRNSGSMRCSSATRLRSRSFTLVRVYLAFGNGDYQITLFVGNWDGLGYSSADPRAKRMREAQTIWLYLWPD